MGFFKKIGSAIKKNVSFKNLVKGVTAGVGFIPGVGGIAQNVLGKITDAVEAKKMAKQAAAEGNQAQADYYNAQAQALNQSTAKTAGAVASVPANMLGNAIMTGVNDGLSAGVVNGSGQVGATVLSSTLKVWFQKNWKIVAAVGVGLIGIIWFLRSGGANRSSRARKSR